MRQHDGALILSPEFTGKIRLQFDLLSGGTEGQTGVHREICREVVMDEIINEVCDASRLLVPLGRCCEGPPSYTLASVSVVSSSYNVSVIGGTEVP